VKVLLVTEHTADDRKSLAAVRSLARNGADVTVASDTSICPPLWSRHCKSRVRCPDPVSDWANFSDWISKQVLQGQYDLVLPLSDYPTMAMVEQQSMLTGRMAIPIPPAEFCALAHDKLKLIRLASTLGIDVPQTWCPANREDVKAFSQSVSFPCVLKLRKGAGASGLSFPESPEELLDCYDKLGGASDSVFSTDRPLIQEYIPGRIHDACMLFNHGEPRAAFTQKRLAMYPRSGGVGIYNQSTDQPELREKAESLLRALKWHGPAMVEFKRDERDGKFKLMEINARYWGTLDLAIQAGVNFPWLACRMAIDGDIDPVTHCQTGLKYRWNWTYGFRYVLQSDRKLQALREFYLPAVNTLSEFRFSDPVPHLVAAIRGRT